MDEIEPGESWVRLQPSSPGRIWPRRNRAGQLRTWSLVLTARGIPNRITDAAGEPHLEVMATENSEALRQIRLYERENRNWPPPLPEAPPQRDNLLVSLSLLMLLAIFHNLTRLYLPPGGMLWVDIGNAEAGRIISGDWWRCFTALTLHNGWQHLAGNLAFGALFIIRLAREFGSGPTWLLLLLAGGGGNFVNALLQSPDHRAVGASTAVFAAVGLFATLSLVRYRRPLWRRWPLPLAAASGLLALLGSSGEQTDLGAHLFGFLCGLALGLLCGLALQHFGRPTRQINILSGLAAALLLGSAWFFALQSAA